MRPFLLGSALALLGCAGLFGGTEGTNPGECSDGADNDGDGLYDCDDDDCAGAPECEDYEAITEAGDVDTDADTDTDSDSDSDADPAFTVSWNNNGVVLSIEGGSGRYSLGLAETGSGGNGWYGESCIPGDEPNGMNDYGYDICHDRVSETGISLATADRPDEVEANATTLFSKVQDAAGTLTYFMAANDDSGCWVWGDDTSYYDDYDCTEM